MDGCGGDVQVLEAVAAPDARVVPEPPQGPVLPQADILDDQAVQGVFVNYLM